MMMMMMDLDQNCAIQYESKDDGGDGDQALPVLHQGGEGPHLQLHITGDKGQGHWTRMWVRSDMQS